MIRGKLPRIPKLFPRNNDQSLFCLAQASLFIVGPPEKPFHVPQFPCNPACIVHLPRQGLVACADTRRSPLILLSPFAGNTIGLCLRRGTGPSGSIPWRIPLDVTWEYTVQPNSVSMTSQMPQAQIRWFSATNSLLSKGTTKIHGIFRAKHMVVTLSSQITQPKSVA
jgi:hypothetical protein